MEYRRGAIVCAIAAMLAGCGGGGSGQSFNPYASSNAPLTSTTATQSIGPAGGAVTATLNGLGTTVTFPAGAFAAATSVTITVSLPSAASKMILSAKRSTKDLPSDKIAIVAVEIDAGSATLLKPAKISSQQAAPIAGSVYRLAGSGPNNFRDVDTATYANGTVTEDENPLYPGTSLAKALYAFYVTANPAAPTIAVGVAGPASNGPLSTAHYTASETNGNGFPFLNGAPFAFSLDQPSLGSIDPNTGTLTTGVVDGSGNVIATDTVAAHAGAKGQLPISVTSERPGNLNDSFTFGGTLTTTTQLTASNITTAPQTDVANVALATTVNGFTPTTGGGQSKVHSDETDAFALQTVKTGTDSTYTYSASGATGTLSIQQSDAKDSNGVEYVNAYGAGNGLLDVLPETAGSFGPNSAALTYTETDPANYGRQRTTAANGSSVELGHDPFNDVQTITTNADLSASYDALQYSGFKFTMSAPTGGTIVFNEQRGSTNLGSLSVPSWIPAGTTAPSTETDVDNGPITYPVSCSVPAKYGTSGNQVVQTINRVDPALGNRETQTTTTYMAPGVGPVCVQLNDVVQTFYDYTLQNGFVVLISGNPAKPLQTTSVSETLTLQSATTQAGTATTARIRSVSAFVPRTAFAPIAVARARFERAVREHLGSRKATFSHSFMSQGVKEL